MSYHDEIIEKAKEIEKSRDELYNRGKAKKIYFSEEEYIYLYGALSKLLRVKNQITDIEKAKDDIIDAYNYCALLYNSLKGR